MENEKVFTYQYSAKQNAEISRIREKYLPKEESKMEKLRRLDNRVQAAGVIEALVLGILGCLVFGIGMCFGLDVFAGADLFTVLFCLLGIAMMVPAYPLYKHVVKRTKAALVPEILRLSDEMIEK